MFPLIDLLGSAVEIPVALGMSAASGSSDSQRARTLSTAGALVSFQHRFINSKHIIAVDRNARDAVTGCAGGDLLDVHHFRHMHRHAILVVVADEHHRQLPGGGHIQ